MTAREVSRKATEYEAGGSRVSPVADQCAAQRCNRHRHWGGLARSTVRLHDSLAVALIPTLALATSSPCIRQVTLTMVQRMPGRKERT
jgi:hypothetical protein